MKSIRCAAFAACALVASAVVARAALPALVDTFKTIRYTVPEGWEARKSDNLTALSPKGEEGLMGVFLIPGKSGRGGAEKELDRYWTDFTGKLEMEGSIKTRKTFKTEKGATFAVGYGDLKTNKGGKIVGMLAVFEGDGRFDYAMTVAQDKEMLKKYSKAISGVLHNVESVEE
jgi:hypothetical protein